MVLKKRAKLMFLSQLTKFYSYNLKIGYVC